MLDAVSPTGKDARSSLPLQVCVKNSCGDIERSGRRPSVVYGVEARVTLGYSFETSGLDERGSGRIQSILFDTLEGEV